MLFPLFSANTVDRYVCTYIFMNINQIRDLLLPREVKEDPTSFYPARITKRRRNRFGVSDRG